MKWRILSLAFLVSNIAPSAYADSNSPSALDALQSQINSLQNQISTLNTSSVLSQYVMTDFSNPFGLLLDTHYALGVLQDKAVFTTPVVLGGNLEADLQTWGGSFSTSIPSQGTYQDGSAVSITAANLDTMANVNDWVTAFLAMQGNVGGNSGNPPTFDKAFLLFGNLQKNPLFVTVGEIYLPFGMFLGNGPWSNNLDTNAFQISKTNQLTLNFYQKGFYSSFAWFNTPADPDALNDFTYNLSYVKSGTFNYTVGAGYLYDIRDTNSGVGAAYPQAGTGGNTTSSTNTVSGGRNGLFDVNASAGYGPVSLNGEFDLTETGATNLNGSDTGKMSAWNIAAGYGIILANIPTYFQVGYSATHNMNNISFPLAGMAYTAAQTQTTDSDEGIQHNWLVSMTNHFFNNVYMSPEYQYSTLYNGTHTWTLTYDISAYF